MYACMHTCMHMSVSMLFLRKHMLTCKLFRDQGKWLWMNLKVKVTVTVNVRNLRLYECTHEYTLRRMNVRTYFGPTLIRMNVRIYAYTNVRTKLRLYACTYESTLTRSGLFHLMETL